MTALESQAHKSLDDDFEQLSWENFVRPMIGTVASLPAANLAGVAEALVGLQVLRQMTQAEMETVGGPLEAGLISPTHGFTWVRRSDSRPQ